MSKIVTIKIDNRYKDGNIKKVKGVMVGNDKTIQMTNMVVLNNAPMAIQLNPPIVISKELAENIKTNL